MLLNKYTQRTYHRTLFAEQLERIQLLKRGDDQRQGEVTPYTLYECRKSMIHKGGQTLDGDMTVRYECVWHFHRIELDRLGIRYLNPLDVIVELDGDFAGRRWSPMGNQGPAIDVKLFEVEVDLHCELLKPSVSLANP